MNKIINQPSAMVEEMLAGYLAFYGEAYKLAKVPQTLGLVHEKNSNKLP